MSYKYMTIIIGMVALAAAWLPARGAPVPPQSAAPLGVCAADARDLRPGEPVFGALSQSDGEDGPAGPGHHRDVYSVYVSGGAAAEIRARSGLFDPLLYVFGDGCELVAVNDDAGDSLDAAAQVEGIGAGQTFRVVVTSWAPGALGGYRLEVRSLVGAPQR